MSAMSPRIPICFGDTIRRNLIWANPQAEREASSGKRSPSPKRMGLSRRCEAGLDTVLGERGTLVSGGERQRLCLARAVLRRPWLFVLDEATSAIDVAAERKILERLVGLQAAADHRDDRPSRREPVVLRSYSAFPSGQLSRRSIGAGGVSAGDCSAARTTISSLTSAPSRAKRISEKCPSGGIGRRSIRRTPPWRAAHCASRSQRNSGCQPSRRASGVNHRSKRRADPSQHRDDSPGRSRRRVG